ncbi:hypothetical protein MASR2M117_03950 [Paludibacter sp.]
MLFGNSSILFKIEAPVVVKPDIVSKKPSATDVILPLNKYGNNPKNEKKIQIEVTITEPSLFPIAGEAFLPIKKKSPPTKNEILDDRKNE